MELGVSWHRWIRILNKSIHIAESIGLSEEQINGIAYRLGDFLANYVDPGNREQRLLQELWKEAKEDEKKVLTRLIARMADNM